MKRRQNTFNKSINSQVNRWKVWVWRKRRNLKLLLNTWLYLGCRFGLRAHGTGKSSSLAWGSSKKYGRGRTLLLMTTALVCQGFKKKKKTSTEVLDFLPWIQTHTSRVKADVVTTSWAGWRTLKIMISRPVGSSSQMKRMAPKAR